MSEVFKTTCLGCGSLVDVSRDEARQLSDEYGFDGPDDVFHELHHGLIRIEDCNNCPPKEPEHE